MEAFVNIMHLVINAIPWAILGWYAMNSFDHHKKINNLCMAYSALMIKQEEILEDLKLLENWVHKNNIKIGEIKND